MRCSRLQVEQKATTGRKADGGWQPHIDPAQRTHRDGTCVALVSNVVAILICAMSVVFSMQLHCSGRNVEAANGETFSSGFASTDCSGAIPPGYARIFIAHRTDAHPGTGEASDPFAGGTAQKFDSIVRSRSEKGVTHLVVCIGPGTFQTEGTHDFVFGGEHLDKSRPAGFTVNQAWRVHGAGMDKTILQLTDLYLNPSNSKYLLGQIIGTHDLDSYGVEVSDLTLDDNYPELKARYNADLQLQAVFLESDRGLHWIHNVHVMNGSGEVAEDFPVEIGSRSQKPNDSQGNIIEHVVMDHWFGGKCTAIAIANATAEVRNNTVTGYWGGYGGWHMSNVNFHDNRAIQTSYGFNIDSLDNDGIVISHNQIVHPRAYGIVIGGIGQFRKFSITGNTITMASAGPGRTLFALILQSNVSAARFTDNWIMSDPSTEPTNIYAVLEKGENNTGFIFQNNQIWDSFQISLKSAICAYGNFSQDGKVLAALSDTQKTLCVPTI